MKMSKTDNTFCGQLYKNGISPLLKNKRKINKVVFAGPVSFMNNRVFDRDFMRGFPGGEVLTDLAEAANRSAFEFMTHDVFLKNNGKQPALLISDMGLGYSKKNPELIPAVCTNFESPLWAPLFHHHIRSIAGQFHHTFAWAGSEERLTGTKTIFHPVVWPNTLREVISDVPWNERKFLTMILGNKQAFQTSFPPINRIHNTASWLRALLNWGRTWWIRTGDQWMKSELYVQRLQAIQYFGKTGLMDLYGSGWDQTVPDFEANIRADVTASWRGAISCTSKLDALGGYKFSICFENTVFTGYITEKIFDCFFAGVIPIYLGAPDITEYIPQNCFIDFRRFVDFAELADYLSGMSESEAFGYKNAARAFLASPAFDRFHARTYIEQVTKALEEVASVQE
jgi:hypothetical protein